MEKPVRSRRRAGESRAIVPVTPAESARTRRSLRHGDVPIGNLREPSRNVRRYSKRQLKALKGSLERFGMIRPVLVTTDGTIVAGVGVWLAAKELKLETIPVVYVEHLTREEIRLYRIADQKLSTLGEYDEDALRLEFLELSELSLDLGLDLDLQWTGFTTREVDERVLKKPPEESEPDEAIVLPKVAVSRPRDRWRIGRHAIYCGNALEAESYKALLQGEKAQMVVCDGPYNVPVKGHVSSRKDAREFSHASGELSSEEFIAFERTIFQHLVANSIDGSIHFHFIDWRSVMEMLIAGKTEYTELKNVLIWVKPVPTRGFYRSQYEMCCVFKHGSEPHICTFGLEQGARWRSNVLMGYAGCNTFGANRAEDLADHPTVKNTSLIADLLRDCSSLNGLVLDAFGGSGTLIQAAELTHRRARLIEIDPLYVDVAIRRAAKRCGLEAVLDSTGQTFAEVALERLGDEAFAAYCDEELGNDGDEEAFDD